MKAISLSNRSGMVIHQMPLSMSKPRGFMVIATRYDQTDPQTTVKSIVGSLGTYFTRRKIKLNKRLGQSNIPKPL